MEYVGAFIAWTCLFAMIAAFAVWVTLGILYGAGVIT